MRLLGIVILLSTFIACSNPSETNVNSEVAATDWTLVTDDGETIRLSEHVQQQPVVLFFWATWCPYCKALMPHLHSMKLEYDEQVEILAINFREKGNPVEFIRKSGYNFVVLPEGDDVAAQYEIFSTPGVLIVDQDRIVRFDLRNLPALKLPPDKESAGNSAKAAYLAPYWAAEVRKSLDQVLIEAAR